MMGINKSGATDCMLVAKLCGNRKAGQSVILKAGQNFTVTFQKNLDHFLAASPGMFVVSIGGENDVELKNLATIPDRGEPSLTLYSLNVTIPTSLSQRPDVVLSVQYITKNPGAPAVFYQCSDIVVQ